jgi:hypothetical protein
MNKKIISNDINAILFRDKLIQLCQEYNCELSGSCMDDGFMDLLLHDKDNNWYSNYTLKNVYDNYNLYKEDEDYNEICIMDAIINEAFDRESSEMAGLNNVKVFCGILTSHSEKAENKLKELHDSFNQSDIDRLILSKDCKELRLKNGDRYVWIKLSLASRGYRCGSLIIDRSLTLEQLQQIVLPMCYACGRDGVEIF